MKLLGRMITWALLGAMISPLALGYVRSPVQAPASCHEHGPKAPAPSPVSYQCCRAGHQFAAVRELVNLRGVFVLVSRVVEFGVTSSMEVVGQNQSRPLDIGSPGVAALRI
jgi:hypothetical protein